MTQEVTSALILTLPDFPPSTCFPVQLWEGLLLTVVSLFYSRWRRGAFLLWLTCSLAIWRCAVRVPDLCLKAWHYHLSLITYHRDVVAVASCNFHSFHIATL